MACFSLSICAKFVIIFSIVWAISARLMLIFKAFLIFLQGPYKNPTRKKINANATRHKPQRGGRSIETIPPSGSKPQRGEMCVPKKLSKV
ncbi:hypothetical protein C6496_17750 [Candidatus Poribacteria bacterium]|nr:MAG: hypothetical protein C6496_17750 [Candidatus Poribacteria bacterium]